MKVSDVLAPWRLVDSVLGLSAAIADEAHYNALQAFVEECFERFASDEHHPVFALVDMVAGRIRDIKFVVHSRQMPARRGHEVIALLLGDGLVGLHRTTCAAIRRCCGDDSIA
jgi:hypothetical protein